MRVTRHAYAVEGWGVGELWEAGGRMVVAHDAPTKRSNTSLTTPRGTPGVPTETLSRKPVRVGVGFVPELLQRIHSYYRGRRIEFADVVLDLEWCTPFQADVARTLRKVPWGEVVSYGELASLAGYPRAQRAVGTFCAHNRYSLFVPCHRVVAADGIGSYGSLGVSYKRRLLRLEGHHAL
ncbi:MAG TPA: methylated-DNA--[protein]-cysteine S-methyltransferase [Gaiellaceae bacterium]|nr:methylated-DNA--[protein]-cysteine S-methyltransferase [Gaiellaceae bacterium]